MSREEFEKGIIIRSRKWVDVPYRHKGRSRNGVDCLGLPICLYREQGYELRDGDGKNYCPNWVEETNIDRYLFGLLEHCMQVSDPRAGDIVALRMKGPALVSHIGVILELPEFIHAVGTENVSRVTISRLHTSYWSSRVAGFFRPKQVPQVEESVLNER